MAIQDEVYDFFFGDDVGNKTLIRDYKLTYSLVVGYIVFVRWIGPALMKPHKPFDLRNTIITYNFFQVVANTLIVCKLISYGFYLWNDKCVLHKQPNYPLYFKDAAKMIWYIFLVKLSDFFDTIFFVLRKKTSQITFLHVFHHAAMVMLFHLGISSVRIGFFILVGVAINTFIHVIMYFYYFLAAFGPGMQRYLWWKRYLTQMQICQFIILLIYMTWAFFTGCEEFAVLEVSIYVFLILLLALFLNFYIKSFKRGFDSSYTEKSSV